MSTKKRPVPSFLGKAGKSWLRQIVSDFDFGSESDWATAVQAAGALDRIEQARAAINEHGLLVRTDRGALKRNPAVSIERESKILFSRLCGELKLGDTAADTEHPPQFPGRRW